MTTVIAFYMLAGAGFGLLGWTLWRLSAMLVDDKKANPQLIALAEAGDVDRARKLCAATPGTYLDALRDACASASTPTPDREALAQSAFDTTASAFVRRWSSALGPGWLGGLLVLSGCALALTGGGSRVALIIVGVLGTLGAGWIFAVRNAATRAIASARADVLPMMLDAVTRSAPAMPANRPSERRSLVLRISRNGKDIESRPFRQDTIKIGRIASSDLILDHRSVSRLHASVENAGDAVEIIDLGSSSGTFVNGQRVHKAKLSHGDVIQIGTFQLQLAIVAAEG